MLGSVLGVTAQLGAAPTVVTARVRGGADDTDDTATRAARALDRLARRGIGVEDFALGSPTLDEVFLSLTERTNREVPA